MLMQFLINFLIMLGGLILTLGSLALCVWVAYHITKNRSERTKGIAVLSALLIWGSMFAAAGITSEHRHDTCQEDPVHR